ncbi:PepSY-associated TM helix domain-containing protein [Pseudorhodoferax sp.]|uniref:PepSY-associated TM helix domain-containing protein n=1 Tax=Pseudorhodoferax sp. TaxID=1993553 RepID=UPI0039E40BB0
MIRADIIKIYKTVHTWTGIICGFALFIAFYAGALTMFMEPIARWASPPGVGVAAVSLDDAPRLIEQVAAAHPEANEEGITLHLRGRENEPARVTWEEELPHDESDPNHVHEHVHWWATLNPDGTLMAKEQEPSELAQFINEIHMRVGIPRPLGWYFMGAVSLLYGVALISGVIVLLPSLVKDFFALRLGKNLKRMWLDAHNVVGITGLPFHIVMAVTSVTLCLMGPLTSAQDSVIYGGRQASVIQPVFALARPPKPTGAAAPMLSPAQLLERLHAHVPDFDPATMTFHHTGDAAAAVRFSGSEFGYVGDTRFAGVILSAVTGDVISDYRPSRQEPSWRAAVTLAALHFGQYGGTTIKWAYFLLGLAGAWLFYGGNLLWVETRRKAQRKNSEELPTQRRDTYWLAAGTVGVCLGCVAGLSATIVAAKWLHGRVADLNHWHEVIYYVVFFASIAWAFARGAARSSVELLWLCAAATLAIPLTTLAALLFPSLGMWAHGSAATIGVDVVAFVGALCFAWMAVATARRVRHGPVDSVWSARKAPAAPAAPATAQEA